VNWDAQSDRTAMSDDLRDRIAAVIQAATDNGASKSGDYAQAIIDDLGLTVGQRICEQGWPNKPPVHQIVGRWEDDE